ncbi:MAG: hypothetical protein AAB881_00570 [Patescibacteria group bacterium]
MNCSKEKYILRPNKGDEIVSATCAIFLEKLHTINRTKNDEIGLNLIR